MDMFSAIFNRLYLEDYKLHQLDAYRPPPELFQPFQSSVFTRKKLFHQENTNFPPLKGVKSMSKFVKLTCSECGDTFLLEAKDPKAGTVAKETAVCRNLNIMRRGEAFEHHQHQDFKWEVTNERPE